MKTLKNTYFAGGCFWCMEGIFEAQNGVSEAVAGYIGGNQETANYNDVSTGNTKHREGVKVVYDPNIISFGKLVEFYWTQIDPTDDGGQFADRGLQYTTAMYYSTDDEKQILKNSKISLENSYKFDKPIETKILPFTTFFKAEEHHQDYYKKSAFKYSLYKKGSGRADFIDTNWRDKIKELEDNLYKIHAKEKLKEILTPIQYKVTQEGGTEPPFNNDYWDNEEDGIYVDIIDGTPLFSSTDKFDSGTGWPSFSKPIDDNFIKEEDDYKLLSKRTELKSNTSHLGHVFEDGPTDKGGLRYCINSAALKFIPRDELVGSKYEKYLALFD